MADDLLEALRAGVIDHARLRRAIVRLGAQDSAARKIARALDAPREAERVRKLAMRFGVPVSNLRAAIALEVGRSRARELAARAAVEGRDG